MSLQKDRSYPPVGVYEHYKSTPEAPRLYQVIGYAEQTETNETLVIYVPLYTKPNERGLRLRARPFMMFFEDVTHNGKTMPRYKFLGVEF